MRKLYILFLLFGILAFQVKAQNFTPDQDTITGTFAADNDEHKIKILINTEESALTLRWRVLEKEMPSEWGNSLCDNFQCYFDVGVGSSKESSEISNETNLPLEAGVNANGVGGEGKLVVKVFDINDSSNADTVTFIWNMTVGTNEVEKTQFNVYPNPVTSTLNISFEKVIKNNIQVKVYNLVGQEQRNVDVNQNLNSVSIDVRKLNNGTYLVQFINANGKMTTQRFTKRM
ncbi:MAG: T9SS type A sorting domain-containing protein [Bacteroidia bacterium]